MGQLTQTGTLTHESWDHDLHWGVHISPKITIPKCGDGFLIKQVGPKVLVCICDGVGSGTEAHKSLEAALIAVNRHSDTDLQAIFDDVHHALTGMRGAAMGLAIVEPLRDCVTWAAIGSIEGTIYTCDGNQPKSTGSIIQRGGTLGHTMRTLNFRVSDVTVGDLILFTTDGLPSGAMLSRGACDDLQFGVTDLVERLGRPNDDRLAFAMRIGDGPVH